MKNTIHLLDIREFLLKFDGYAMSDYECDAFALLHASYLFTVRG